MTNTQIKSLALNVRPALPKLDASRLMIVHRPLTDIELRQCLGIGVRSGPQDASPLLQQASHFETLSLAAASLSGAVGRRSNSARRQSVSVS